jgi:ABC-type antimicrobial peptide transport system permease subunit
MNLSTARSANRSREVGVRKSIGAQRSHLVVQFIGEAVFLSFIAMLFAIVIVKLLLPFFNDVTDKSILLNLSDPVFVVGILSITIVAGILAGSYPAFIFPFNPVKVLKGTTQPDFLEMPFKSLLGCTVYRFSNIGCRKYCRV